MFSSRVFDPGPASEQFRSSDVRLTDVVAKIPLFPFTHTEILTETTFSSQELFAKTPFFPEHFLSGSDNGRVWLFRACSVPGWPGDYRSLSERIKAISSIPSQNREQG